ncbi:MAG: hypothetical protein R3E39_30865 [Anaerolineae bacterium]
MYRAIVSRHRLPRVYRLSLTGLWLLPAVIFLLTFVIGGLRSGSIDVRLLFLLGVMSLPALYVWHEGVDVLADGLQVRIHGTHYYRFDELDTWYIDTHTSRRRLTIWKRDNCKVLECHPAHLSDMPVLMRTLKEHLRYRHWPE